MKLSNEVAALRRTRGWSQAELALRSGVSRAEVSAIETGRLAPSTATALRLARSFDLSVEALFTLAERAPAPQWAWGPAPGPHRFWEARVGDRRLCYPVEPTASGESPHDGVFRGGRLQRAGAGPERTVVVAGCDPAAGLLAHELRRTEGVRLIAFTRGSREALELLRRGLVHVAGVHWSGGSKEDANGAMVRETLGSGYRLLHLVRWQEGIAVATSLRARSARTLARQRLRWVAREEGSGARHCLDRLLGRGGRRRFRHVATGHREVTGTIRSGFAQAGVAVRLAAEEAGLDFLELQQEDYELCFREELREDPGLDALRRCLTSSRVKGLFGDLPGYDVRRMGRERSVSPKRAKGRAERDRGTQP